MLQTADEKNKHVLVIDDIADNIFLVQFVLEAKGYKVSTANSGEAALNLLETARFKPDLIILDLMMPGMNGYEVINCLRKHHELAHICVFLMTANTEVSYEKAKEAGADGILYKPLDIEKFGLYRNSRGRRYR